MNGRSNAWHQGWKVNEFKGGRRRKRAEQKAAKSPREQWRLRVPGPLLVPLDAAAKEQVLVVKPGLSPPGPGNSAQHLNAAPSPDPGAQRERCPLPPAGLERPQRAHKQQGNLRAETSWDKKGPCEEVQRGGCHQHRAQTQRTQMSTIIDFCMLCDGINGMLPSQGGD